MMGLIASIINVDKRIIKVKTDATEWLLVVRELCVRYALVHHFNHI